MMFNKTRLPFNQRQTTHEEDTDTLFCAFDVDLDLDSMSLIHEYGLDILKMYLHTKMNFLGIGFALK